MKMTVSHASVVEALRSRFLNVDAILLFGSRAKGRSIPASDADVMVLVHGRPHQREIRFDDPHLDIFWSDGTAVFSLHRQAFLPETLRDIRAHGPMIPLWMRSQGHIQVETGALDFISGVTYRKS